MRGQGGSVCLWVAALSRAAGVLLKENGNRNAQN